MNESLKSVIYKNNKINSDSYIFRDLGADACRNKLNYNITGCFKLVIFNIVFGGFSRLDFGI